MSFTVDEEKLARDLGLPKKTIAELRKKNAIAIVQKTDWDFVERRITYTEAGAKKIASLCGAKWSQGGEKTGNEAGGQAGGDRQTSAIVTEVYKKNWKCLAARKDRKDIVIRVGQNANFIERMEIPGEKLMHAGGALWDFIGKKPKARGVW